MKDYIEMELDITKCTLDEVFKVTKGKTPCSICVIQNTCTASERCEPYQEYKRKREKKR